MARKHVAALAALTLVSTPCAALDGLAQQSPGMTFYFSVPLDGRDAKERRLAAGFALQGKRPYETVRVDSRMFNFIGSGIEAKWIIAGVVAAGAVVAVASKDKSTAASYQEQQQAQQQQIQQREAQGGGSTGGGTPCPVTPTCP